MPEHHSKCFGNFIVGINDYDAIFTELKSKGFNGWISIEDGVDGMEQLARSVEFLKKKIAQHWG